MLTLINNILVINSFTLKTDNIHLMMSIIHTITHFHALHCLALALLILMIIHILLEISVKTLPTITS